MRRAHWLLLAAAVCAGSGCREEKPRAAVLTPVSVHAVEPYQQTPGTQYAGNVEPASNVAVAFRVGGYIQEIHSVRGGAGSRLVQEGDRVARGTVLARLRETDYTTKVDQARSQLAQALLGVVQAKSQVQEAQVALELAKTQFGRASNLFDTQSITRADFDAAKAQFDMTQAKFDQARDMPGLAKARVEGAQAMVREGELAIADCALKAPIDGVVIKRMIEVGSLVGPGSPGFVLADTRTVKVVFGAPDSLLPRLKPGNAVTVTTEAIAGTEFTGRITRIAPAADPRSRVFDVEVTIPNPRDQLKVGMMAAVEVGGQKFQQSVPVVPVTAIVRSKDIADGYAVFVAEDQGGRTTARARNVKLGQTFGNLIGIADGLRTGEQVITTGATLVRDGEQVQIVR